MLTRRTSGGHGNAQDSQASEWGNESRTGPLPRQFTEIRGFVSQLIQTERRHIQEENDRLMGWSESGYTKGQLRRTPVT